MLNIHMLGKGASLRHIRIRVCQVRASFSTSGVVEYTMKCQNVKASKPWEKYGEWME